MVRNYQRTTNRRPEGERGLHVVVTPRRQPDLELLARIIVDMAITDPWACTPPTTRPPATTWIATTTGRRTMMCPSGDSAPLESRTAVLPCVTGNPRASGASRKPSSSAFAAKVLPRLRPCSGARSRCLQAPVEHDEKPDLTALPSCGIAPEAESHVAALGRYTLRPYPALGLRRWPRSLRSRRSWPESPSATTSKSRACSFFRPNWRR